MLSEKELMTLKKSELVAMAEEKGLSTSGTKQELTKRLVAPVSISSEEETFGVESEDMEEAASVDETPEPVVISMAAEEITDEVDDVSQINGYQIFTEMPSRRFIAGGHHYKPFLATLAVIFLLMFSFGFQDYYSDNFSFEGSDKEYVDCIHITYYSLGDGNDPSYDPTNQANIDCAEVLDESPNWWQEEKDEWLQSILDAATSVADTNSSEFVWSQSGIETVTFYGANYFGVNMSIYGDPIEGDEFTAIHLATWNSFAGGNDTFVDLLPGGAAQYNVPTGIIEYAPTGYVWLQPGIDIVTFYGANYFGVNMSVYGDPIAGDEFTAIHLATWNGFAGSSNTTFADLSPGGAGQYNIPSGIIGLAPTGYHWSQSGIETVTFYGANYFGVNMSIYGDPIAGDEFTAIHLATWNGFAGGNDTFLGLTPGGAAQYNVPTGIIMSTVELVNQTPIATNVSIVVDNATTPFTYSCDYVYSDAQNGTDNSTVMWFVNGSYASNSTQYNASLVNGSMLMCVVTPYDALYWGVAVESESLLILATED